MTLSVYCQTGCSPARAGPGGVSNAALPVAVAGYGGVSNVALPVVVPSASGRAALLLPDGRNNNVARPDAVPSRPVPIWHGAAILAPAEADNCRKIAIQA